MLMRIVISALMVWLLAAGGALASGGGSSGPGGGSMGSMPAPRSPDELAMAAYKSGVKQIEKAKSAETDAAVATDSGRQKKESEKAARSYGDARDYFTKATAKKPGMYEAWNYLGYSERKLGNYPEALSAYDHALQLNPNYGEAIEYRGEAYLGLNRTDDAKAAYLQLFGSARPLADQLMTAMHLWVAARREDPKDLSAGDLDAFAHWVDERGQLAQQTASLGIGLVNQTW